MRAIYAIVLLLVAKFCYGQEQPNIEPITEYSPLFDVAKSYFRSNPFNIHFSSFLNHLTHDPTLTNKKLDKRTDTSLFFFQGDYNGHNPYNFKADRVEILLAEREVNMGDSTLALDTLLFYQLAGYAYGAAGTEAVKKEFSRFERKFGKNFYGEDSELKKGDESIGVARNYFLYGSNFLSSLSPLSISWAKLDEYQNVFTITFRIKLAENTATLPQLPQGH